MLWSGFWNHFKTILKCSAYQECNEVIIDFKNGDCLAINANYEYSAVISDNGLNHEYRNSELMKKYQLMVSAERKKLLNETFVVVDGYLIRYNGNNKHITLPDGITHIMSGTFEKSDIESIKMPSTLKDIGDYSFRNCKGLTSVILNEGLEAIGDRAFCACESLNYIKLPESVKLIRDAAFLGTNINSFDYIPENCEISEEVFQFKKP